MKRHARYLRCPFFVGMAVFVGGVAGCQHRNDSVLLVLREDVDRGSPRELNIDVYNRSGVVGREVISQNNGLNVASDGTIGTVVIDTRIEDGPVRIAVHGNDASGGLLTGTLIVNLKSERQVRALLVLDNLVLSDADGDGVPDSIDDCLQVPDPDQLGYLKGCAKIDDGEPGTGGQSGMTSGLAINGSKCSDSAACESGICSDGICCDAACDGGCKSCAIRGSEGRCTNVAIGTDPASACEETSPESCGTTGVCDGRGACEMHPAGTVCRAAACAGQNASVKFSGLCDGTGTCQDGHEISCAPYSCSGGACRVTCQVDSDCAPGKSCVGGSCGLKPVGASCFSGSECSGGHCADGVCCESACDGVCVACNLEKTTGACVPIPPGGDSRGKCAVSSNSCGTDGTCDGARHCAFRPSGTSCETVCEGDSAVAKGCDGAGECNVSKTVDACNGFACAAGACRKSCSTDYDCATTNTCSNGSCVPRLPVGSSCTSAGQCATRNCAETGVCCPLTCETPGCQGGGVTCGQTYGFECTNDGFYVNQCCYSTLTDLGSSGDRVVCGGRSWSVRANFDLHDTNTRISNGEVRRDFSTTNLVGQTLKASIYVDGPAVPMNLNVVIITTGTKYDIVKTVALSPGWNHVTAPVSVPSAATTTGIALQFYLTRNGVWTGKFFIDEVGWR